MVKNLPAMQETQVRSLGRFPGEGNGNPLQYSCLENPMDRGACWATVCGVPKSRTRLTLLSYFPKKLPGKRGVSQLLLIRCFDWRPKANSVLAMKTFVCFYALKSVSSQHLTICSFLSKQGCVDHPIVLTEAVCTPLYSRQMMSELLFECYGIPKVAYGIDSLFSFYHNNPKNMISSGLIISSGYQCTHILPILEGR